MRSIIPFRTAQKVVAARADIAADYIEALWSGHRSRCSSQKRSCGVGET